MYIYRIQKSMGNMDTIFPPAQRVHITRAPTVNLTVRGLTKEKILVPSFI